MAIVQKVRKGWETNSSSSHTLVIDDIDSYTELEEQECYFNFLTNPHTGKKSFVVNIEAGFFGQDYETYSSPSSKISYLYLDHGPCVFSAIMHRLATGIIQDSSELEQLSEIVLHMRSEDHEEFLFIMPCDSYSVILPEGETLDSISRGKLTFYRWEDGVDFNDYYFEIEKKDLRTWESSSEYDDAPDMGYIDHQSLGNSHLFSDPFVVDPSFIYNFIVSSSNGIITAYDGDDVDYEMPLKSVKAIREIENKKLRFVDRQKPLIPAITQDVQDLLNALGSK